MKGVYLGEFEELVLLVAAMLQQEAYGVSIQEEIERQTERKCTISAVHTALHRLEEKGFLSSEMGGATNERGGRRKRYFKVTVAGIRVLTDMREQREKIWRLIPGLSMQFQLS
jgi:PadR family transcriptional regulator, regulatory protein PadR